MRTYTKRCPTCGVEFKTTQQQRNYCCVKCRVIGDADNRKKKKEGKKEQQ